MTKFSGREMQACLFLGALLFVLEGSACTLHDKACSPGNIDASVSATSSVTSCEGNTYVYQATQCNSSTGSFTASGPATREDCSKNAQVCASDGARARCGYLCGANSDCGNYETCDTSWNVGIAGKGVCAVALEDGARCDPLATDGNTRPRCVSRLCARLVADSDAASDPNGTYTCQEPAPLQLGNTGPGPAP
jgi:hypothetical protein